jgi:predicted chitinase
MCRQIAGCTNEVAERVVGTDGWSYTSHTVGQIKGRNAYEYESESPPSPYVQEHADLIASIRKGEPLNEGKRVAESTLTAIMGRMSAYTGRALKWDWAMNSSKLDLTPSPYQMGADPVAIPGKTKLI